MWNICTLGLNWIFLMVKFMFRWEFETQDKGNEFVKMGKKHYTEALDCYTRAIDQKIADPQHNSVCHANRSHVHLLVGNNRRAYEDAKEAIRFNDKNVKVCLCPPNLLHICLFCSSVSAYIAKCIFAKADGTRNQLSQNKSWYDWIQSGFGAVELEVLRAVVQLILTSA